MEQLVKQFSLIDFLGIVLPGGILALAANYYVWDLTTPCIRFFGTSAGVLSAYFLALSYLCGCVLHQLGICLEYLLPNEKNVFASHCHQTAIQTSYQNRFGTPFPNDPTAQVKAGREILRYVQRSGRPQRIVIFSAFYAMSRTMLATIPLLFLITIPNFTSFPLILMYIVTGIICYLRWRHFDQCCISEAYTIFSAESFTS